MNAVRLCRLLVGALAGAVALGEIPVPAAQGAQAPASSPHLVVILVVDQMRADYVTRYGHQWTKGLRRLLDTAAVYPLAQYPYADTVTCAGHATISTGTFPAVHGLIGNEWYDRGERRSVTCTAEASESVPFGGRTGSEHHGPTRLKALTFTDELHRQLARPPTVVTLSLKARSSIMLAGRPTPSTYAVWLEDDGTWATSTAYTTTPWPIVDEYAGNHPISQDYGREWTRALPASSYVFSDWAEGERTPVEFPHPLVSRSGEPNSEFATLWKRSPQSDRYLGQLGQHLVRELRMGQEPGTDVLGVSFSALDLVGHEYGPYSHEVQDILIHLDETVGVLLNTLDQVVGRDRYVVALSSDHGVAPIPEQDTPAGDGTRRLSLRDFRTVINEAVGTFVGPGPHVVSQSGPNVYLAPGVLSQVMATPGAREAIARVLQEQQGIARVFWADELESSVPTNNALLRAARLSYVPGRSGDLMVMYAPYWMARAAGTTHGTPHSYDQRVPLLFAGAGIKPGRYLVPATPADIAPTLAHLVGITLARVEGQVLTTALK